jgi:leucyl aminopeptidase
MFTESAAGATPLHLVTETGLAALLARLGEMASAWAHAQGYQAERGRVLALPDARGRIVAALYGLGSVPDAGRPYLWDGAGCAERLPAGNYQLADRLEPPQATLFALGWLLGVYRYARYRASARPPGAASLVAPPGADLAYVRAAASATTLARDLVNTPANDLGPAELAEAVCAVARRHGGEIEVHSGDALRERFPLVHAVGQGSARAPLMVDCRFRRPGAPRVTLVGKGVCFDTGGLDLKPSASMLLMKKDMGGAACALALAQLLLELEAPVELRLLVPAVENSVGGRAFRPGDVWKSRKGLSVEIGNTDAEGRLVLADALAAADEDKPDLLIDLATLTGAARTALGPDLPALFASDAGLAEAARAAGEEIQDPLWPMPLWSGYDEELSSRTADLNNVSSGAFAGAIIGALFLRRFVAACPAWIHVDLYAWNPKDRPGRPQGAEAQAVRALYALIRKRLG